MQQRTSTSQPSEIPEDIICPITSHIMTDHLVWDVMNIFHTRKKTTRN